MTLQVPTPTPVAGRPQSPIYPLIVGNNGAYLAVRSSSAQGSCGVHGYPCKHPGVDVNGPAGTIVRAPESGQIVAIADGSAPPFSGYGPWLVIIHGQQSGRFHLLAHLEPDARAMGPIGKQVVAGDPIGRVSSARHTHWEVRKKVKPGSGETNFDNNIDPIGWLMSSQSSLLFWGCLAISAYLLWEQYR